MQDFHRNWMEFFFLILALLGLLVALSAQSPFTSYAIIFISGIFAGRILYTRKDRLKSPYVRIIGGFLIGYLIGIFYGNRIISIILFIGGVILGYRLFERKILKDIRFYVVLFLLVSLGCARQEPLDKISNENLKINETSPQKEEASKVNALPPVEDKNAPPALSIISPKDGGVVNGSSVVIKLESDIKEGEGEFRVWLDTELKKATDKMLVFENVVSGKHSIVAELVRSENSSFSPKIRKTITINVVSGYTPKTEAADVEGATKEYEVEADDKGFYPNTLKAGIGDKVRINFRFRDTSIYYAGLDVKGPFDDIKHRLNGEQPQIREFEMKGETKIISYWPSTLVKKGELIVEVE